MHCLPCTVVWKEVWNTHCFVAKVVVLFPHYFQIIVESIIWFHTKTWQAAILKILCQHISHSFILSLSLITSLSFPFFLSHSCSFSNCIVFYFLDFSLVKWLRPLLIDILTYLKLCPIIYNIVGNNFVSTSICLCVVILVDYISKMKCWA